MRSYPAVTVTPKAEKSLRGGHPWVYAEEAVSREGCADGEPADVYSGKGKYLGTGLYNSRSKILVRVVSRNANDQLDEAFWSRRLRYALDYRRTVMGEDFSCCRLLFGEADGFPGVTVDRFEDVLSVQIYCLGMAMRRDMLLSHLVRLLRDEGQEIRAVYERSDSALCGKEGMEPFVGFFHGEGLAGETDGHVLIRENGIAYDVDYLSGQKTGFFLDQKYNRAAAARLASGRRVLDCFTHTGAFALNAAKAGAERVTAVDVSREALELARENAKRNRLEDKVDFLCRDVFELLTELAESKRHDYDYVILDPPAFTKSNATVANALRGYKEINLKAMRLLPRGGYLATCTCSHFMHDEAFRHMLRDAAQDAGVQLRQIEARRQAPDHPILWNVPETEYLKFYLFQVV